MDRAPILATSSGLGSSTDHDGSSTDLFEDTQRSPSSRIKGFADLVARRIPYYLPILSWAPKYTSATLPGDLLAGVSVGVILIPMGIAYASLANLPPIFGLYTAFYPTLLYVLFGTSRNLSVGPDGTTSILIGQAVTSLPGILSGNDEPVDQDTLIKYALALTFLVGILTLVLGLLRLGFIDSVLSAPILTGFVFAVALILIVEQLPKLFGLPPCPPTVCHEEGGLVEKIHYFFSNLDKTNWRTLLISIFCIAGLLGMNRIKARYPQNRALVLFPHILVFVVLFTLISYLADLPQYGVVVLGSTETGFRTPAMPKLTMREVSAMLPTAVTIAMLGFVESQLISKKYATKYNYTVSPNRELVALGLSNLIGSFFGAYTAYGSLTRTKVSDTAGGRSHVTGAVAALLVCVVFAFAMPLFNYLPRAVTGAIIFSVALGLIEVEEIHFIVQTRQWRDLAMLVLMLLVTFFFGVDSGIFFAFGVCLLLVVKMTSMPSVTLLGRSANEEFHDVADVRLDAHNLEGMLIFKIEGPLFFANSAKLKESTQRIEFYGDMHVHPAEGHQPLQLTSVIFDFSSLSSLDSSAAMCLHEIVHNYDERGVRVCIVRPKPEIEDICRRAGIISIIERNNFQGVFWALRDAVVAVQSADHRLARPSQLASGSQLPDSPAGGSSSSSGSGSSDLLPGPAGSSFSSPRRAVSGSGSGFVDDVNTGLLSEGRRPSYVEQGSGSGLGEGMGFGSTTDSDSKGGAGVWSPGSGHRALPIAGDRSPHALAHAHDALVSASAPGPGLVIQLQPSETKKHARVGSRARPMPSDASPITLDQSPRVVSEALGRLSTQAATGVPDLSLNP